MDFETFLEVYRTPYERATDKRDAEHTKRMKDAVKAEAAKRGLTHAGGAFFKDSRGNLVARSVEGKLVPYKKGDEKHFKTEGSF